MESLRQLFWLHYQPAGPLITLWDEWMPMSTLWPAMGSDRQLESMRMRWAAALASRGMSTEGYVHTHQHDGPAHAEGWPFPLWMQAGGIGWHFRGTGVPGYDAPPATPEGWTLTRASGSQVGQKGWEMELTEPQAFLQTPPFAVDARTGPWLRLNWWAAGLEGATATWNGRRRTRRNSVPSGACTSHRPARGGQSHMLHADGRRRRETRYRRGRNTHDDSRASLEPSGQERSPASGSGLPMRGRPRS